MRGPVHGLSARRVLRGWVLAVACAAGAGLWGCATHEVAAPVVAEPDESQLNARGVALRQAIQASYERLGRSGGVDRQNGNDITNDVLPFFPRGITFDQAEKILRGAGFTLVPRPVPQGAMGAPGDSDEQAVIDPFMPPLVCRTSVTLRLRPQAPFDYQVVAGVNARFATVCPAPGAPQQFRGGSYY